MKKSTKFLWWCAGAKTAILENCPTEHSKYFGIGGTILFTALMASFAGGYAFETAFDSAGLSVCFGIFWGLLIFNLDRYIVSTIGKGDGTPKITKEEWKSAAPRLIMAIILGIVISTPLELKLFEKEINVEVEKMIREQRDSLRIGEKVNIQEIAKVQQERDGLIADQDKKDDAALHPLNNTAEDEQISEKNKEIPPLQKSIDDNTKIYNMLKNELQGIVDPSNSKRAKDISTALPKYDNNKNGNNNKMTALKNTIEQLKKSKGELTSEKRNEVKELKEKNKPKIDALEKRLTNLQASHDGEKKNNDEVAKQFNGLMAKLEALSRLSKDHLTLGLAKWLITLLLVFIEVAPILFKLMTESGPYDDIIERIKHEVYVNEKQKISNINDEINTNILISTEKNKGRLDAELQGNKELLNAIALAQADIAKKAVEKWKEREITKLDKSLSHIIQSNQKEDNNYTDKFWVKNDNGMESIYCFKKGTSNEIWLRENNKIELGKWTSLNAKELEIEFENEKKLFHIDELTETNFKLSEVGTQNKLNLTIT